MKKITRLARTCLTLAFVLALASTTFADTIRLKDGSIIKGTIVSFGSGKFVVVIGEGERRRELTFTADEIESIRFDAVGFKSDATPNEPQFVETSSPPTGAPRVVVTDPAANTQPSPAPAKAVPPTQPPVRTTVAKPIEVSVKVLADNTNNGWTNSGWVVRKGQKIRIIGGGTISLGQGRTTGPSGLYDTEDPTKLLKSVPTGALIAVIGDDNNQFIYVGSERTFTASRDGALFLGVNEGNLKDNSGSFDVKIEIDPA
ncbi:MAG: LecA/PA-IL family lectin [Pyrinomonadaceae bacterium]